MAAYVLVGTDYKMDVHLYNDAPGLAILQSANRNLGLTPHGARIVLLGVLVASVAVLLAPRVRRAPARALLVSAALFVLAWNVTGQMAAASASRNFSDELLQNYPRPLNWLDQADHGRPAMYLGQQITDANAAIFDPAHQFRGCIPGIHEILRRQGFLEGRWCLDPREDLSPGQIEEIDRVCRSYPHLQDDTFVQEHLDDWLS